MLNIVLGTFINKLSLVKYLVVGLGNIGEQYDETRHNIGFKILDTFAQQNKLTFKAVNFGTMAIAKHKGRTLLLLKPDTFMNLSGRAIKFWMQKEKIPLERLLVLTDDLALPFGKIRIRAKGSDGGHNGIKSVIQELESAQFPRLRFGISDIFDKGKQVDYVLGKWCAEEKESIEERIDLCIHAIKDFSFLSLGQVMTIYNAK